MSDPIPCPFCVGGRTAALVDYEDEDGGDLREVACDRCGGTGLDRPDRVACQDVGSRIRRRRFASGRTLWDEGRRLGLTPGELSRAEFGRLPMERMLEIEKLQLGEEGGAP